MRSGDCRLRLRVVCLSQDATKIKVLDVEEEYLLIFRWVFPTLQGILKRPTRDRSMHRDSKPNMAPSVTGVILAGGKSTRFSGINKSLLRVGNERILDRILLAFRPVFQEIILVTNEPVRYLEWDVKIVADLYDFRSSLIGLHAGLFHSGNSHAFVSACDTPFLVPELVKELASRVRPETDVLIPETASGFEPLCAVYSRRCLQPIERNLQEGRLKIQDFFPQVRVETIAEADIRRFDEYAVSFININTAGDLSDAEAVLSRFGRQASSGKDNEKNGT
jgi:molybdopterin-guanine dinucleotide biosynthesis protein A